MADRTKRRAEILDEIVQLGTLQKKAVEDATFMGRSPTGNVSYEQRARRIARLVSELVGLETNSSSTMALPRRRSRLIHWS
jgi:hypothetical protein